MQFTEIEIETDIEIFFKASIKWYTDGYPHRQVWKDLHDCGCCHHDKPGRGGIRSHLNSLRTTTQNVASFSFLCQWKTDPIASKNREMQSASVFRCKFWLSAFCIQALLSSSMDSTHSNSYVVPLCLTNSSERIRKKPPKLLKYTNLTRNTNICKLL